MASNAIDVRMDAPYVLEINDVTVVQMSIRISYVDVYCNAKVNILGTGNQTAVSVPH